MKRVSVLLFLLIIVVFFAGGCGEKDDSTIRVGVIAELTGDMPAVGESCKKAAELAVKEINDAGGLQVGDSGKPGRLAQLPANLPQIAANAVHPASKSRCHVSQLSAPDRAPRTPSIGPQSRKTVQSYGNRLSPAANGIEPRLSPRKAVRSVHRQREGRRRRRSHRGRPGSGHSEGVGSGRSPRAASTTTAASATTAPTAAAARVDT